MLASSEVREKESLALESRFETLLGWFYSLKMSSRSDNYARDALKMGKRFKESVETLSEVLKFCLISAFGP